MKVNLLDLTHKDMKNIKAMFDSGEIKIFKDLILKLMDVFPQTIPEDLYKALGSYVSDDKEPITWDRFLFVIEEEVKINEKKKSEQTNSRKKVYLQQVRSFDLSQPPHEFLYTKYSINYFERVQVAGDFLIIVIVNKSFVAVFDEGFKQMYVRRYFARDYMRHFKNKFLIQTSREDEERRQEAIKKKKIGHSDRDLREADGQASKIVYHFDVIGYSGIKKRGHQRAKTSNISGTEDTSAGQKSNRVGSRSQLDILNNSLSQGNNSFSLQPLRKEAYSRPKVQFNGRMNIKGKFANLLGQQVSNREKPLQVKNPSNLTSRDITQTNFGKTGSSLADKNNRTEGNFTTMNTANTTSYLDIHSRATKYSGGKNWSELALQGMSEGRLILDQTREKLRESGPEVTKRQVELPKKDPPTPGRPVDAKKVVSHYRKSRIRRVNNHETQVEIIANEIKTAGTMNDMKNVNRLFSQFKGQLKAENERIPVESTEITCVMDEIDMDTGYIDQVDIQVDKIEEIVDENIKYKRALRFDKEVDTFR